jgi:hypothetical protein
MSDFKFRLALWLDDHPHFGAMCLATLVFVLGLGAIVHRADAATVSGTITHATKYDDGSDLGSNYKQARVEVGTCVSNAFGVKEGEATVAPGTTAWSVTVPRAFGDFCARAVSETVSGLLSSYTAVVKVTKVEPKPQPPVLATPTVAAVYELIPDKWDGVRLGRNVGTVPAGTGCDPNREPILGWYDVKDHSQIKFTKNKPKSDVLVTKCQWRS